MYFGGVGVRLVSATTHQLPIHSSLHFHIEMPFADSLRSSEPPELPTASSSSGGDDIDQEGDGQQNMGVLAAAAAARRPLNNSPTHHYRMPQSLSEGASPGASVLGRRQRDSSSEVRTGRDKVRIETFTRDTCAAMGVPTAERDEMLVYSQVSQLLVAAMQNTHVSAIPSQLQTHELLIVYLCKAAADRQVTRDTALNTYLKSPEFKVSFVTGRNS